MSPIVPHAYMKEEIYLIRWLRGRKILFEFKNPTSINLKHLKRSIRILFKAAEFHITNAEELLIRVSNK